MSDDYRNGARDTKNEIIGVIREEMRLLTININDHISVHDAILTYHDVSMLRRLLALIDMRT